MKQSIRMKLTIIFGALIAGTFVAYIIFNALFLENYYMDSKQRELIKTYENINESLYNYENISDEVKSSIYSLCEKNGVALLILDWNGKEQIRTGNAMVLANRMSNVFFAVNDPGVVIIEENKNYVLQKYSNKNIESSQYLELYGFMDNGQSFIMRMPIESIKESIAIFNNFFVMVSLVVICLSLVLMFLAAKKFTKPILELADISKKMTNLDFNVRYEAKNNDEIGILGKSMNEMSKKLENTISELKRANNELQKDIEKKTEIDEMRKEFLSNVSHELKTPIALISGYAEGLEECVNDDEESRNYYCEVIMDEANKMNKMVKQLLSLNRLEFGENIPEMEHFDITQVLNGIKQSFDIMFEQKEIKCILSADEGLMVWADEFQIEEVITNYISNAVNHCEGEKIIKITAKRTENEKIRIEVFNTGNCISEDEQDKVWIKFYKIDKARSREYGGSGIGLSIVKAVMEAHNEKYGVYNEENGVVFWFEADAKLS